MILQAAHRDIKDKAEVTKKRQYIGKTALLYRIILRSFVAKVSKDEFLLYRTVSESVDIPYL